MTVPVVPDQAASSVGRLNSAEFERCFRHVLPGMSRYARSLARDQDAAQDLVQEAALRAWQARSRFEAGSNFKAWCHRILRNCFLTGVRRQQIVRIESRGDELPEVSVAPSQEMALDLKDVQRSWKMLTPDQQRSLTLVVVEGHSYEEAATIEQVELGTLKSRVARGRSTLSGIISGDIMPTLPEPMLPESMPPRPAASSPPRAAPERPVRVTDIRERSQADLLREWRARRAASRLAAA